MLRFVAVPLSLLDAKLESFCSKSAVAPNYFYKKLPYLPLLATSKLV
jgi:hypothetical protein